MPDPKAERRPHHPHRARLRGFGYFRRLGPGFITGAADDDPGGIGTYSQVGASLGFSMLWTALVSLPLAIAVEESAARLGLAPGRGLSGLVKDRFPRPIAYLSIGLVVAANTFNIGADLGSMGAAFHLLVPVSPQLMTVAFGLLILVLEVLVPYDRYARILRWLALSILAYVVELAVIDVPWARVLRGLFLPHVRLDTESLAALVAVFGTTISPYLFLWQAAEEEEEQQTRPDAGQVTAAQLTAMRVDVASGMGAGVVVMFAILVTSAATLGAHHVRTVETASQAARALEPIAGTFAALLFTAGIVGTGLLSVPVLAGSAAYAMAECFGWREGLSRKPRDAKAFYGVIGAAMLVGVGLNFLGINPIRALFLSAIFNGIAAPPLLLLMLILARSRSMGGLRSGWLSTLAVGATLVLMTALPVAFLVLLVR